MLSRIVWSCLCIALIVLLAGCSGAGTGGDAPQGPVATAASHSLSAFTLVKGWLGVLYPPPMTYTHREEPATVDGLDGWHIWGTLADGATFDQYSVDDVCSHATTTWPDGRRLVQNVLFSIEDGLNVEAGDATWSDGHLLTWRSVTQEGAPQALKTATGTATTPEGQVMTYELVRQQGQPDRLAVALPDGSTLSLNSATAHLAKPDYATGLSGAVARGGVAETTFRLWGVGGWDNWSMEDSGGYSGVFAIDSAFGGSGGMTGPGGVPAGHLRWTGTTSAVLTSADAAVSQVTPSAAAQRYQIGHWIDAGATIGPAPF